MNVSKIIAMGIAHINDSAGKHTMVFQFFADGTITSIVLGIELEPSLYKGLPVLLDDLHIVDDVLFHTYFERWDD